MVKTAAEVFADAQKLSGEEREKLALMIAQDTTDFFASPEIEQAWMEEVQHRLNLRESHPGRDVPGEAFLTELRQKYSQ